MAKFQVGDSIRLTSAGATEDAVITASRSSPSTHPPRNTCPVDCPRYTLELAPGRVADCYEHELIDNFQASLLLTKVQATPATQALAPSGPMPPPKFKVGDVVEHLHRKATHTVLAISQQPHRHPYPNPKDGCQECYQYDVVISGIWSSLVVSEHNLQVANMTGMIGLAATVKQQFNASINSVNSVSYSWRMPIDKNEAAQPGGRPPLFPDVEVRSAHAKPLHPKDPCCGWCGHALFKGYNVSTGKSGLQCEAHGMDVPVVSTGAGQPKVKP